MILLLSVVIFPGKQKKAALVAHPLVVAETNTSETITCESHWEALDSCVWGRPVKGQRELITIEKDATAQVDAGQIDNGRISTYGDGLQNGNCSLRIQSITAEDFGTWFCALFGETGSLLTGQVEITHESKLSIKTLAIFRQQKYLWIVIVYSDLFVCEGYL